MIGQDGTERKDYYGEGEQPWDTMVRRGWAACFAAGCILKYIRRNKEGQSEHDLESICVYFNWLSKLAEKDTIEGDLAREIIEELVNEELTNKEKRQLQALGLIELP